MKPTVEFIWQQFHAPLKGFILRRVSDESAAEDILQNVFAKIHSHIDTLNDDAKIESWIFSIARNTIIDYHRAKKTTDDLPPDLSYSDKTLHQIDCKTGYASIKAIIETLPETYAQALLLTEFEGLTQKELAQRLGISVSGAKSRVQRAREMLKTELNQCCRIKYDRHGTIVDYQCSDYFLSWLKKIS